MIEKYRLKKMAKMVEGDSVLDVGCSGIPNPYFKAKRLVGFDLNECILTENYDQMIVGDVYNLPKGVNEKFDSIVIGEVLEHVENPTLFLKKCISVLKPNGKLILSTPNPHSPFETILTLLQSRKYFYDDDHVMLYPQRWLVRIMENSGLKEVKLYSGGIQFPFFGLIPFFRTFCYQTIAIGYV